MSYDYMFFRLRKSIASHLDLSVETTRLIGSGAEIRTALSRLFPDAEWRESHKTLWGSVPSAQRCEFQVDVAPSHCFKLLGSYHSDSSGMVARICEALGLVALDLPRAELIGSLQAPED
jgi:hypothetical protein